MASQFLAVCFVETDSNCPLIKSCSYLFIYPHVICERSLTKVPVIQQWNITANIWAYISRHLGGLTEFQTLVLSDCLASVKGFTRNARMSLAKGVFQDILQIRE